MDILNFLPPNRQVLCIAGNLPGRNEAEKAARTHWSYAARLKKDNTELVYWECVAQQIKPVKGVATIAVAFYEKDLKRDADNVLGGLKYILDGLVLAKVIPNDCRKRIKLFVLPVGLDRDNPRVEVYICE
jgi:hypothetical protein